MMKTITNTAVQAAYFQSGFQDAFFFYKPVTLDKFSASLYERVAANNPDESPNPPEFLEDAYRWYRKGFEYHKKEFSNG